MAVVAFLGWLYFRARVRKSRIPDGENVYQDTERLELFGPMGSHTHGRTGKPDYITRTKVGLVPIEVKSRSCGALAV